MVAGDQELASQPDLQMERALCEVQLGLHSALGFWSFPFVLMWGISGIYFSFPDFFGSLLAFFDPRDRFYDPALSWLSQSHFGRFGWYTEALWSALGLVLALLSISGVSVCCHRMIYKKSANPNRQSD